MSIPKENKSLYSRFNDIWKKTDSYIPKNTIVSNEKSPMNVIWDKVRPYIINTASASIAIIPAFYGFQVKSDQQLGKPSPKPSYEKTFLGGVKAAPTIGIIINTQMFAQETIENLLFNKEKQGNAGFFPMFVSSVFVGALSAHPLAAFNAQTSGKSPLEAVKQLSLKETGAITVREGGFLLSFKINEYIGKQMKNTFGDNQATEYGATFISGAMGSLCGHPADTALTRWQNRMPVSPKVLVKGALPKAGAVGIFAVCYKGMKNILDITLPKSNK